MSAWDKQVGGSHYTDLKIGPTEYAYHNQLHPLQYNVVKYVTRYRSKGGLEDLNKAIHCLELLKELEYGQPQAVRGPDQGTGD